MNQMLMKQLFQFSTGHPQWINYALGCIDAEICPLCGNDLVSDEMRFDKTNGESVFFECLSCGWHEYVCQ